MSPDTKPTKLCPTCGTRLSENASRCPVCGTTISTPEAVKKAKPIQGTRMPEITLSLPVALGILALVLIIGAVFVYIGLNSTGSITKSTETPTPSLTPTITLTPTASLTPTIAPTWTRLPPIEYTIASGDSCISIALAFNVSVASINPIHSITSKMERARTRAMKAKRARNVKRDGKACVPVIIYAIGRPVQDRRPEGRVS